MEKPNYKKSLNLPKTPFSMKANLAQNEPLSMKRWKKANIYDRIQDHTQTKPPFIFHDGPPYANGSIHIGHLLNKVLKDFVVRSQHKLGRHCPYIPGWDCHGLPIEHRVMTDILKNNIPSSLSRDERHLLIRKECQTYAKHHIKKQSKQMEALLTLADYPHPYLTMTKGYEAATLNVFAEIVKEDLVYRELKPVHWSIANQTALAEAELEYQDRDDTAIHVLFPATGNHPFKTTEPIHFLIWTTTPWTLPANLALAINENETYALVQSENSLFVIAKERFNVIQELKQEPLTILEEVKGKQLIGLSYTHPFCERTGTLYHGPFVTMEDGSGIVHIAPGHGQDDYILGKANQLDIYCPVLADGTFDNSVPDWIQGQSIWDANDRIIEHLNTQKRLYHSTTYTHSYPHDWRSKTPVIFRSTEQWFIGVDRPIKSQQKSLRKLALHEIESKIEFYPKWGKNRLYGMLESRPDWCLSRQRSWGLPIPAFRDQDTLLLTPKSIQAIAQKFAQEGSDCWFKQTAQELLSEYDPKTDPDAPSSLVIENLEKMNDIFDVWFESGSSWHAVCEARGLGFPADLYLEGSDQHRGWFHLSLLPALAARQTSPFKRVLTHGFMVDKEGRKMSKSGGNALDVDEILKHYGAEVMRWWVGSLSFENDIKVDRAFFDEAGDSYRKIRNTLRFLLSNIYDLDRTPEAIATTVQDLAALPATSIDRYALEAFTTCQKSVHDAFKHFNFKLAHQTIYQFCNDTLSSFYCSAVKDRLYCDQADSERRINTQRTIWIILDGLLHLLYPYLPHTTEECYSYLYSEDTPPIYLASPQILTFDTQPNWPTLFTLRSQVLKKLEEAKTIGLDNPLDANVQIPQTQDLTRFEPDLCDILGVSRIQWIDPQSEIKIEDIRQEPRCERSWRRDITVKKRANGHLLSDRDAIAIGETS